MYFDEEYSVSKVKQTSIAAILSQVQKDRYREYHCSKGGFITIKPPVALHNQQARKAIIKEYPR
jgi:hypothetical protein